MRKPIIFGNWKMNKNRQETKDFLEKVEPYLCDVADFGIAVPYTCLDIAKKYGVVSGKNFKAKIIGIYECPKDIFINDTIEYTPDCMPENYIFIPQETVYKLDSIEYQTNMIYVYMKSSKMIKDYIKDMQNQLGKIIDDITQPGGKVEFKYSWDENWNQSISAP